MKKLFSIKFYFVAVFLIGLIIGCSKNDLSIKELFVYTPTGNVTADVTRADFMLIRDKVLAAPNSGFPAVITRPFDRDVEVSGMVVDSLLARYDSINGTVSPELPAGLFVLKNNSVTIPAGEAVSVDSFYVEVADISKKPIDINRFIIPVEISSENSDVPTSDTRQVMYVEVNMINVFSSIASTTGSKTINASIDHTPVSIQGPDKISFTAQLNRAISEDVEISVELGSHQDVDKYNADNGMKYKYFPDGTFSLNNGKVVVDKGSLQSDESFEIGITNLEEFLKDSSYLLVIKVKDEGIVMPDVNGDKLYIIVTGTYNNVDLSNTNAPATLLDRSQWKVADLGDQIYGEAKDVLDNNYNTSWMTTISTAWISIDMQEEIELEGIQISPNYAFGVQYNTPNFEIYTSVDGLDWEKQGEYRGNSFGGSVANPDIRNIHFFAPISSRYFRINYLNIGSSGYAGASEIKGF